MRTSSKFNIEIYIRPKYNLFNETLLINPFEDGPLNEKYKKEALTKCLPLIQRGITSGEVNLTTIQKAIDTIYIHSQHLAVIAYFKIN